MSLCCSCVSKRIIFSLTAVSLLIVAMFMLAGHLATYTIFIADIYYLVFSGLLLLLDAIIFFFMFFQFICNRKLLFVAILGLGFLGADIYWVEVLVLIQEMIALCIPLKAITNDLAIFYLFRQLTLMSSFLIALFYARRMNQNIAPVGKDEALVLLLACIFLVMAISAHNLSSYNPQISLNLMGTRFANGRNAWNSYYGVAVVAAWFMTLVLTIVITQLRSLLWCSIAAFCVSSLFSNIILLNLNEYNFPVWYLSRGVEVVCTFFVIVVLLYDIFKMHKKSTMLSIHDPLTGIYNRAYFYQELQQLVVSRKPISLMIMDIDHFKRINDRYGHPAGDAVIKTVVALAKNAVREEDILARIGGEEFAVLLHDTPPTVAARIAERIRVEIERETAQGLAYRTPEPMTISIGLFCSSDKVFSADECISFADSALYAAKRAGRNRVMTST